MSYLLDTNVLSELRKGPRADAGVAAWADGVPDDELFLSVLVVGEVCQGIERIRRRDRASAHALERWLSALRLAYASRILAVDREVAERWGRIAAARSMPVVDALLVATALTHGLTLVTRNVRDVSESGVDILNPFSAAD